MSTDALTPDALRALIAEAEKSLALVGDGDWTPQDNLLRRATTALSASLPREDAKLDAQATAWAEGDGISLLGEHGHVSGDDEEGYHLAFNGDPRDLLRGAYLRLASRTIETAEVLWGVVLDDFGSTDYYDTREEADEAHKRAPDTGLVRVVTTTIVPPTPEQPTTARECGNDSHHGYGTGYCGDCTKEAGK